MLVDTHVHLDSTLFDEDRHEVIQRAIDQGVTTMVNIGFNATTIPSTLQLAKEWKEIWAVIGWHPSDAKEMTADHLDWIEQLCRDEKKVVALGEMGLDYYHDSSFKDKQQQIFREQIRLARKLSLPIVIHNREAHLDIMTILKEEKAYDVGGIMHCFSGSWEIAKECLDMNFYISFGGPITFKNAKKPKEVLKEVPLNRLLIETDAPYLTPHPYRGKRNESGYVKLVAEAAAELKGLTFSEISQITTENARRIFRLNDDKSRV